MAPRSSRRESREAWHFNKNIPETLAQLVSAEQATAAVGGLDDIGGETVRDVRVGVDGKRRVARAIYEQLRERGIRYDKEGYAPASSSVQRVRAPAEMIRRRRGTCLDLSLLFAGVALDEGLDPMVIVFEDHAIGAVVAANFSLGDASNPDGENVQNWVRQGSLVPIECTGFAVGEGVDLSFEDAVTTATARIASTRPLYSLDINRLQTECDIGPNDPPLPRRVWVAGVAVVLLIAAIGLIYALTRPEGPGSMNEFAYNVAIAEFEAANGVQQSTAADLSDQAFDQISLELTELGFADVWAPERTGSIPGDTPEDRAAAAGQLADDVNADVVLYGTLRANGAALELQPEFFLNDRRLSGANELVGSFRLGSAEPFRPDSLNGMQELQASLAGRTKALALFVLGLSAYADADYDNANDRFVEAEAVPGWDAEDGKEVVYLFLGNVAARQGLAQEAAQNYERALSLDDDYARAWIGLAGLTFQEGSGDCATTADAATLGVAEDQYEMALFAEQKPPLADIDSKASFGLGRIDLCLHTAGLPGEDPSKHFSVVIADYDAGNGRIEELAWESHAGLGIYYATTEPADYGRAISEYRAAIEIIDQSVGAVIGRSDLDERKAVFYGNMGDAMRRTSDPDYDAAAAYETAIELTRDDDLQARLQAELVTLESEMGP